MHGSDGLIMSKKISIGMAIVLMLLAVLITFQLTFVGLNNKYRAQLNELSAGLEAFEKLAAVDEIVRTLYIGDIDEEELSDMIIRGYIAGTGDKYAYYLDRTQFAEFVSDNSAEMQGIGVFVIAGSDAIEIINVMPESPALEAGLEPGDLIIAVGGESVASIGYNSALNRLKGEAGTPAEFTVYRDGKELDFSIERGYVNEQTVMSHIYEADKSIGIVKILSFDKKTATQFKAACDDLIKSGVKRFVFDVRYNPGGDLEAICDVLDYLLPEGPMVRIKDGSGKEEVRTSDASELDVPMTVLINSNTASAAELFASALQDYKKATLVGETTFGKGTVQRIISLPDGTGIGISNSMYYPPYSDNFEDVGVIPDVACEMDESVADKNIYKITDAEDTQLQKAIEILNGAK